MSQLQLIIKYRSIVTLPYPYPTLLLFAANASYEEYIVCTSRNPEGTVIVSH
jgi:hypothetical protein